MTGKKYVVRENRYGKQVEDLPVDSLIDGELKVICEVQAKMAQPTADFIQKAGMPDKIDLKVDSVRSFSAEHEWVSTGYHVDVRQGLQGVPGGVARILHVM